MLGYMALVPVIELPDEDKLVVLRRLDQFRAWHSVDDKRYCLACGKLITGRDIRVIGGTRGNGPLRIICPTERCHSIPMDWVLPTDEVLAKSSARQQNGTSATTAIQPIAHRRFRASLHKFATHFRRIANLNARQVARYAVQWTSARGLRADTSTQRGGYDSNAEDYKGRELKQRFKFADAEFREYRSRNGGKLRST
jgi:hypothetical protein